MKNIEKLTAELEATRAAHEVALATEQAACAAYTAYIAGGGKADSAFRPATSEAGKAVDAAKSNATKLWNKVATLREKLARANG